MGGASEPIDVFLQPGEYFVGNARHRIYTLLGSCVSVTLWHRPRRIGAMSHFLLARSAAEAKPAADARYGEDAIWLMMRDLVRADVEPRQCVAKIFGGGDMFAAQPRKNVMNVGERNGEVARRMLRSRGIPIVSESLYGLGHRHVVFDVANGDVWVRHVSPATMKTELRKTA